MKDIVVLYHGSCADGFSGAWAAKRKFGETADYIGVQYQTPPPVGLQGKKLYLIDFTYSPDVMRDLLKNASSLTSIDHHISARETVLNIPDHIYDEDHSGAVLAWKYFFPQEKVPTFFQYIEDGDLWSFKLPRSKDFYSFMLTLPFEFNEWGRVVEEFENDGKRASHLEYGAHIREYQENIIGEQLKEAQEVVLEGHSALAVNSSVFESQAGNIIINKGYDIGIIWRYLGGGDIKVSLRSKKEGGVDVRKIAEKYGGGGHTSAAGFILKLGSTLPWQPKH
jgi:oligoribonuclease NrnB/cAMP/cGMP phosphodiesterase (DHH superfamily)